MKYNYPTILFFKKVSAKISRNLLLLLFVLTTTFCYTQVTYTFVAAGATGSLGPTQLQLNTAYFGTNLQGAVVSNNGIQSWTVPVAGNYRVYARGGQGAGANGGYAAIMQGDFTFAANDVIRVVVGQVGGSQPGEPNACGGGGGSFVLKGAGNLVSNILVIAGGGGGSPATYSISRHANTGTSGNWGAGVNNTDGAPGINGNGGNKSVFNNDQDRGAGGGGFFTDGQSILQPGFLGAAQGGTAFLNGCYGGSHNTTGADGGFGGGGAVWTTGYRAGGGGGGYSGGGGGQTNTNTNTQCGGGGGSFNSGINQVNSIGTATGDGIVIITALCNISMINASSTGPGPICSGNSATLTSNAIGNYVWSNGGNTATIVVSPTVTTSYTLTAVSPNLCTASSVITVTVDTNTPTVSVVASNASVCAGKTVTLTASGANSYTWTGGVTNAVTFTPLATSGYTVTGANACASSTAAVTVSVNPSPAVVAGVTSPTVCNGSSVTFTSGGNATAYTWSHGVLNNVPYIPAVTADYTVVGSSANNCTTSVVVSVTVLVTPTIVPVATPTSICVGQTAILSAVGATGYTWTPGTNPNTSTLSVSPPGPTTYTLFRTNGLCSNTSTVYLMVNPLPLVNASGTPNQICAGTGVNLNVLGAISYTWLPGGFTTANFTLFPNNSTCYTVTGSNGSCTATSAVCVTVNPTPVITINSSTNTICQGQSLTLTAGGGLTYTWQPMNTGNLTEIVSPSTTTIITLMGSNSFNCIGSASQLILVNQAGSVSVGSSAPYICNGGSAMLSIGNPSPNVVYSWSGGQTGTSIPVSPTITTNYTVTGTNTITGCAANNTVALSVYISTFSVVNPTAICKGQTATLSASGAATSYSWNVSGGVIAPTVTVAPVLTSTYYVTGVNGSCSNSATVPVIVNPLPNVTAVVAKSQICRFETATITGGGASTYTWDTGSNSPVLTFTLSGTTTYTLTGTDNNGCSKTTTVTQFVATCIGIDEAGELEESINIYPNPNAGAFIVSSELAVSLRLVNALGQEILTIQISENEKRVVTVEGLPAGIYFISGQTGDRKINRKIVVER